MLAPARCLFSKILDMNDSQLGQLVSHRASSSVPNHKKADGDIDGPGRPLLFHQVGPANLRQPNLLANFDFG